MSMVVEEEHQSEEVEKINWILKCKKEADLKLIKMDTIEITETDWLWYPYIP